MNELIDGIVKVVIDDIIAEWRKSREYFVVHELDMQDLPMPKSGMTGEQLARYFDLQVKGEQ
jgi:hypothetical protein